MSKRYAIEMKKPDINLVTALGSSIPTDDFDKKTWMVFDVDENGRISGQQFVTDRELARDHEVYVHGPTMVRLKR